MKVLTRKRSSHGLLLSKGGLFIMCEANAYLKEHPEKEATLLMEAVDIIEPYEDGLKLVDIFGRQKFVKARIGTMNLLQHRIILEPFEDAQAK